MKRLLYTYAVPLAFGLTVAMCLAVSPIYNAKVDTSLFVPTSYLDTNTALTANSDTKIATQKATKAYNDAGVASAVASAVAVAGSYTDSALLAFTPRIIGTAVFDPHGGAITNLAVTGSVQSVTYNATGKYDVLIDDQADNNFIAYATVSNNGDIGGATMPPQATVPADSYSGSAGASGFRVEVVGGGTLIALPTLSDSVARRVQIVVIR